MTPRSVSNADTGFDVEVIKAVAKKAGWQLKFVQSPFDAIFPALDANRIDARHGPFLLDRQVPRCAGHYVGDN